MSYDGNVVLVEVKNTEEKRGREDPAIVRLRSGVLFLRHGEKRYFLAPCLKKSTLDRRLGPFQTI